MKNIIVVLTFILTPIILFGQTFTWGFPFTTDSEEGAWVTHMEADAIYRIKSKYDLGIFNYRISSDKFDSKNLEIQKTSNLGIVEPAMGRASQKHLSMYPKNGTSFLFFSTENNTDKKVQELFWQDVNIDTWERSEFQLLSSIPGQGLSNYGDFLTAVSPDGIHIAVLKIPSFDKKTMESVSVELYGADFKKLGEVTHTFDYEAKRGPLYQIQVGNDGTVYIANVVDLKKEKPWTDLYVWAKGTQVLGKHSLKQADNYQITQNYAYFLENEYYLVSLLSADGSTTFGMSIDQSGRNSGAAGNALLVTKYTGSKWNYSNRNDFESAVSNLSIKAIMGEQSGQYVVMERLQIVEKSGAIDVSATNVAKDYTYLNNGYLIAGLDGGDGSIYWYHRIDTNEPNTRNDNGTYLSVLPLLVSNNLVIVYNETREILPKPNSNRKTDRFPIMEYISPKGEVMKKQELPKAMENPEEGVTELNNFDLDTSVIVPISDDKFLIRARENYSSKYGYLTFP